MKRYQFRRGDKTFELPAIGSRQFRTLALMAAAADDGVPDIGPEDLGSDYTQKDLRTDVRQLRNKGWNIQPRQAKGQAKIRYSLWGHASALKAIGKQMQRDQVSTRRPADQAKPSATTNRRGKTTQKKSRRKAA